MFSRTVNDDCEKYIAKTFENAGKFQTLDYFANTQRTPHIYERSIEYLVFSLLKLKK